MSELDQPAAESFWVFILNGLKCSIDLVRSGSSANTSDTRFRAQALLSFKPDITAGKRNIFVSILAFVANV